MKRFGAFVIAAVVCIAVAALAVGPPVPDLSGKYLGGNYAAMAGIKAVRFVDGDGLATATTIAPFNVPGDGKDTDVQCTGVFLEGKVPFYYIAYLKNGKSTDSGTADYYTIVDTVFTDMGAAVRGASLDLPTRPCFTYISAELDSIYIREGAGTDTVFVSAYF